LSHLATIKVEMTEADIVELREALDARNEDIVFEWSFPTEEQKGLINVQIYIDHGDET